MVHYILPYTLMLSGHITSTTIDMDSLADCLKQKEIVEQYYENEPDNNKTLEITCRAN